MPAVWQFLGVLGIGGRYYRSVYVEGYRLALPHFAEDPNDEDYAEAERLKNIGVREYMQMHVTGQVPVENR